MEELKMRIKHAAKKPDIIMITEVKPKNARYILEEVEITL